MIIDKTRLVGRFGEWQEVAAFSNSTAAESEDRSPRGPAEIERLADEASIGDRDAIAVVLLNGDITFDRRFDRR